MATHVEEPLEESEGWPCFSATLRIFGDIGDLDAITAVLGVEPTHAHRRGEGRLPNSPNRWEHGMWSYTAPVPEDRTLQVHLKALWRAVRPHVAFLKGLKRRLTVDVFCGYRPNCGTSGFEVDHRALVIFQELEVPFGVSVIFRGGRITSRCSEPGPPRRMMWSPSPLGEPGR